MGYFHLPSGQTIAPTTVPMEGRRQIECAPHTEGDRTLHRQINAALASQLDTNKNER